jgi:hypothetical protein
MKILTCASFYGTGSSAITDFYSECDGICSLGNGEYRFLWDPDGVADLEYNIVENNNRHNSGYAIKRFIRYMKQQKKYGYGLYDVFEPELESTIQSYLQNLIELESTTWWNQERMDRGRIFVAIDRIYSLAMRLLHGELKSERRYSLLQKTEKGYYTAIDEETFLAATQEFVENLLNLANPNKKEILLVDQLVPPTNTSRYIRYGKNIQAVVVDRDPVDLYLLEKNVWKWGVIPVNNAQEYVKWFKITRKYASSKNEDSNHILRIQFEDLIYEYDKTTKLLLDFAGLKKESHIKPKAFFNPAISIKNTNLAKLYPENKKDIDYIRQELSEYCYPFEKYSPME